MRKVILTSHGHLAEGMQSAVNMILGCQADLEAVSYTHLIAGGVNLSAISVYMNYASLILKIKIKKKKGL